MTGMNNHIDNIEYNELNGYSEEACNLAYSVIKQSIQSGSSIEDAIFKGVSTAARYDRDYKISTGIKTNKTIPLHLKSLLDIADTIQENTDEISKAEYQITGVQSLNSIQDIYTEGDYLVVKYSSGFIKRIPVLSIVQNIAVKQTQESQVTKYLESMTSLNSSKEPELLFTTDGEIITSLITIE